MSLRANGKRVVAVVYNDQNYAETSLSYTKKINEIYSGNSLVWPDNDLLWVNACGGYAEGQEAIRRELSRRGLDYRTVTEIPFKVGVYRSEPIDAISYGTEHMFSDMTALSTPPVIVGAENITEADNMFRGCESLPTFGGYLKNLRSADSMFYNCYSLKSAFVGSSAVEDSILTNIRYLFYGAKSLQTAFVSASSDLDEVYAAFYADYSSPNPKDFPSGSGASSAGFRRQMTGGNTVNVYGVVVRVAGGALKNKSLDRLAGDGNGLTFEPYYRETSTGFARINY